ncbi:MAG: fatty acid hydroxylase [Ponticaulis sp.]|nr:fatty acid hydroxylase [Ponticaulis sp.]|tara:strand:- start:22381 stop:23184 length:804 start_codon:yes stop_codon:yes gene_type:complete
MTDWAQFEVPVRLGVFAGVLLLLTGLEVALPRKARVKPRASRWLSNVSLLLASSLILRFAFPLAAVGFAVWMEEQGLGLFNILPWPVWLEVLLAIILFDLAIWTQHVLMHYVPPLWAFHRVHHTDEDLDASSGFRFHPGEMLLSFIWKLGVIWLFGPAALAVFLFEVLLNAASLFEHANIRLPKAADAALRKLIVTPDMHRVHHSVHPGETNSNFGFCLSIWDRLFRTYIAQPRDGHDAMTLGLDKRPDGDTTSPVYVLSAPFKRPF